MKLLQKQQTEKQKMKYNTPKKGMFSYGSYLQQRKAIPYNISYNSILNYLKKNIIGKPSNNFLLLLENRLDTTLCRIRFAQSIPQARQLIYHKRIQINGRAALPGYQLKPGDILSIKKSLSFFLPLLSALQKTPFRLFLNRHSQKNKKRKISKKRPTFLFRPLNYEINFVTGTAIFLYPPQKLYYSQRLYPDFIRRSYKQTL
jgi:small subunit ribosomal protein S4